MAASEITYSRTRWRGNNQRACAFAHFMTDEFDKDALPGFFGGS
jgi:hypothetical protein